MALQPGQIVARYRLAGPLGQGGMGVVWRAEDLELKRPVALKFVGEEALAAPEAAARFLREARTAAALNHPGICTIYEVGRFDPGDGGGARPFIAMELLEGRTLATVLRDHGGLPAGEWLDMARQVAEALAAAHAGGIIHRDLKPGNIMILRDGRAKILDFGLARPQAPEGAAGAGNLTARTTLTSMGTVMGTVTYMSPEQAEGKSVDSRSDIFSFGATLYEAGAGRLPFHGDTTTATVAKLLEAEPEPLESIRPDAPADLARVVQRCLRKRPEERYNDTRDLVAALREARLEPASAAAGAREASPEPARRVRRRVLGAGLAAAVLLAVLVPIAWMRLLRPEAAAPVAAGPAGIAVLPFDNMSAEEENDYFAAGMTEEIISKLSRLEGLQVASRTAVAPYKGSDRDPREIGQALGVRYLLEGSVRRAGDRVRIVARLTDSGTGFQVWSDEFEGTLDDVFTIQERTALKIAEGLDLELSPQEERAVTRRDTENPAAYDSYLRAQALLSDWSERDKVEAAGRHLRDALEKDPDYPLALAGLASVEAQIYRNFDPDAGRLDRAERDARRAAELDPDLPRARMALGEIAAMRFDYERAADLFRQATRLTPDDPFAWDLLSWALAYQEPPDAAGAEAAARKALELQPRFPGALYHLGRGLLHQGRLAEARDAFEGALEQNPEFTAGHMGLAQYYLAAGEHQRALAELDLSEKETSMALYYRSCVLADAGDTGGALENLRRAMESGFRDFRALDASPYLQALRADPRLAALVDPYRTERP